MTMQPHDAETNGSTGERDRYATDPQRLNAAADPLTAPTQPTQLDDHPPAPATEPNPSPREAEAPVDQSHTPAMVQPSMEEPLFASADLSGLRSRWDDVQAGFVDDPRKCVQTADGLVSDVVQQLTDGFSQARSKLEQQWARGEDVSTEDLRLALKRYREFFDRLLAV